MEASYENPWMFEGKPFESERIGKHQGFVYLITDTVSGQLYVGKKFFHSIRKVKGKTKRQRFESDWKDYYSSSEKLKSLVKAADDKSRFRREILSLHLTRGQVNYHEVKQQFVRDVLYALCSKGERLYMNDNILGRYYAK